MIYFNLASQYFLANMNLMLTVNRGQCLGPENPETQKEGYLTLIFVNICKVMWLLWHLYIRVVFPYLGLAHPHSQITSIFYSFLALICVSGSFGPKFEFTAKNNASGFFSDIFSEAWK